MIESQDDIIKEWGGAINQTLMEKLRDPRFDGHLNSAAAEEIQTLQDDLKVSQGQNEGKNDVIRELEAKVTELEDWEKESSETIMAMAEDINKLRPENKQLTAKVTELEEIPPHHNNRIALQIKKLKEKSDSHKRSSEILAKNIETITTDLTAEAANYREALEETKSLKNKYFKHLQNNPSKDREEFARSANMGIACYCREVGVIIMEKWLSEYKAALDTKEGN